MHKLNNFTKKWFYGNTKKYQSKLARSAILIDKEKNEAYKNFVLNKGYNSLNNYFNIRLYAFKLFKDCGFAGTHGVDGLWEKVV